MGWFDGFREWYATHRSKFLCLWGLLNVFLVMMWMTKVSHFTHASVVSSGTVVAVRNCGTKADGYTYRYEVDGQAYTGESGFFDARCNTMVPGVTVIPITYRADNPSQSMSGTVHAANWLLMRLSLVFAVICLAVLPVLLYVRGMRSRG
jgi:hypothetical protein